VLVSYALHTFALSGFAIAQPLLNLLGQNPAFFISHHSQPREIVVFMTVILFVPPMTLWLGTCIAHLISPALGQAVHWLVMGTLTSAVALAPLTTFENAPAPLVAVAALLLGIGVTGAYARLPSVRAFMTLLALAPLIFALLFIAHSPVSRLVSGAGGGGISNHPLDARAPVVMVLFDELAVTSVLTRDGSLDAARFPAFAELARDATFYRRATAVHTGTIHAVPAILTGNYPVATRFPTLADHPRNLFSFLEAGYEMHVVESETMLYRGNDPHTGTTSGGFMPSLAQLVSDARFVYLHLLLPRQWTRALPSVDRTWKNFAEHPLETDFAARAEQTIWVGYQQPQARFEAFTAAIEPCEERCLHFLHTTLPHQPWQALPSGRRYSPRTTHGLVEKEQWGDDAWEVAEGYQQHLLQVGAADRLLGELLARLKRLGLYDRALIVVTADHGVSFWPGESLRRLTGTRHPEDMIHVPLIIKAPNQQQGSVSDRRVQTIDILPTIANLLGSPLPWPVDGCSAISPSCSERPKIIAYTQAHERLELEPEILDRTESLDHKLAAFSQGDGEWPFRLRIPSLAAEWAGRRITEIGLGGEADYSLRLTELPIRLAARHPESNSPARLSGHLRLLDHSQAPPPDHPTPTVVVGIDGVVEAVVPAIALGRETLRFSAFVPEESLGPGRHEIALYLVSWSAGLPLLAPAFSHDVEIPEPPAEQRHE